MEYSIRSLLITPKWRQWIFRRLTTQWALPTTLSVTACTGQTSSDTRFWRARSGAKIKQSSLTQVSHTWKSKTDGRGKGVCFVLILVLGVGVEEQVYSTESHWYVLKWAVDSLKYADNLMNCIFCNFQGHTFPVPFRLTHPREISTTPPPLLILWREWRHISRLYDQRVSRTKWWSLS